MMYYRGIRFCKDFVVQYLNYIFFAGEKGLLLFTDGTKKIEFTKRPQIVKMDSWDARQMPAILVGASSGNYIYRSIDKDHIHTAGATDAVQERSVGGDISLTLNLSIRATTIDERDNLVDIACIYLAHPDAKTYFERQAISLPAPPTISGESKLMEPSVDYPIYATSISIPLLCIWRDTTTMEDRLENIIVDIEANFNL